MTESPPYRGRFAPSPPAPCTCEELADLLESALSGATKPSLEARVDRMLGGL